MNVCFGLSSGIGNAVFCLPAIRALFEAGHDVTLYVDGDYVEMYDLFARCRYVRAVVDGKRAELPPADRYVSGHWCPPRMQRAPGLIHARWTAEPSYHCAEWALPAEALAQLGIRMADYAGAGDVSDWCHGVDRRRRFGDFDVGIVPGSKGGIWERKRYPHMRAVIDSITANGLCVGVFGTREDYLSLFGGSAANARDATVEWVQLPLVSLPDALARCRVVIGTDSGPTHLASSLGVPVVMVFTATSAIKGDPVGRPAIVLTNDVPCRPCQATTRWMECRDWACRGIPADRVVEAALTMLPGR